MKTSFHGCFFITNIILALFVGRLPGTLLEILGGTTNAININNLKKYSTQFDVIAIGKLTMVLIFSWFVSDTDKGEGMQSLQGEIGVFGEGWQMGADGHGKPAIESIECILDLLLHPKVDKHLPVPRAIFLPSEIINSISFAAMLVPLGLVSL
jgi:hypothetical protein